MSVADFTTRELPNWCPGCGGFTINLAIKTALSDLGILQKDVVIVSGIGCGSKMPHFVNTYGFESLHGRGIAVASGIKLANPDLKVMVTAGDGDTYGIGGNHFMQIMRRNIDLTLVVENNAVYGLTKGQYSPTTRKGTKTPSSPFGSIEEPLNPIALAIVNGATYVARGYAHDAQHLTALLKGAITHKGFALVDILQPCASYNKVNSAEWYQKNIYKLEGNDTSNKEEALKKAMEWDNGIPIGLFYKQTKQTYEEQALGRSVVTDDISNIDITPLLAKAR